jgi:hypothetical protein
MAKIPVSTQTSLWQRLSSHAEQRWPQIKTISTRYRAGFAYVDAELDDGENLRLCRLRYGGSAHQWGFAIYRASHDDYEDSYLPTGYPVGTAEEALDTESSRVPCRSFLSRKDEVCRRRSIPS